MKKLLTILGIFTMTAIAGGVAISCTKNEMKTKPEMKEKEENMKEELPKELKISGVGITSIGESQFEKEFDEIKKEIGPKVEKFINSLKEDQENGKLDALKTKEAETFFNSKEGESLSKLLEFYEDSKSFSSLNDAISKITEKEQNKLQTKINFLKHMKEIFEDYKKHENKITSWIQKFNS
ncbi:lipoprotein [Mycoplasma yeatsii]|uniref:lipoprotein n=1 Tax=Mycoplasma yeatsii TaxID=51365 RepID=UPI0005B243D5|nr:lipoprotein [Mycoplasma yeatsii]AJM71519.1 lipoprotein [Mycoplasma yeatsii GM274B]